MAEIIPAVLVQTYDELKNKIALVRGVTPVVQIDICDGQFVPSMTWPFLDTDYDQHFKAILEDREGLPFWEDIDFELDLMVLDAMQNFDSYLKLGPRRVIFHLEAFSDIDECKYFLEGIDPYVRDVTEIGIAINTTTDAQKIFPLVNNVDFIQCMGIAETGKQGQDFDPRVFDQIQAIKNEYPDVVISVDGAVSEKTAKDLVEAGANRLVIGSAIFNSDDIINRVREFQSLC